VLQPSVTKVGGLGEAKKICTLAGAWNVDVVPHSFYFGPGLAATLHLIAATPGIRYAEFPGGELATPLLAEPIRAVDGWLAPPSGPGLGVTLNEEAVRRHPYTAGGAKPFTTHPRD
jgi:L-alanine-DL-glutamate epimerase-like enolase superfamily enzyme